MRIVMVTDDIKIDRRILLEAESLIKLDNEVILLAGWAEGLPFHEKIGQVKVERIVVHNSSRLTRLITRANTFLIKALNIFSTAIQKLLNHLFRMIDKSAEFIVSGLKRLLTFLVMIIMYVFVKGPTYVVGIVYQYSIKFANARPSFRRKPESRRALRTNEQCSLWIPRSSREMTVGEQLLKFFNCISNLLQKAHNYTFTVTGKNSGLFISGLKKLLTFLFKLIIYAFAKIPAYIAAIGYQFSLKLINFTSSMIQDVHRYIFVLIDKITKFGIFGLKKLLVILFKLIIYIFIKIPAYSVNAVSRFAHWSLGRIANRNLRDDTIKQRILYFNPDVIHIHDLPQLKAGYLARKKLPAPLVYDAHELYPEIDTLTKSQKRRLHRMEKQLTRRCDNVITVNEFIAEQMSHRYKIPVPNVIYNAVNPIHGGIDENKKDLFRKKLGLSKDTAILLFQGWMSKTRGLQDLVSAMASVDRKVHLVLMGYGEVKEELQGIIKKYALHKRVHILDAVPQDELLYWTQSADAGIVPYQPIDLNNYYCSPNKLFEFIQAHLPIIANDLPFLRKIVVGNCFGIVAKLNSPVDYANAINAMFGNMVNYEEYKRNLKNLSGNFSWEIEEQKLYQLYGELNHEKFKAV